MLDGPRLPDELLAQLTAIDEIEKTRFSPECTTQAKPAVLVLTPFDDVDTNRLEDIGARVREILRRYLSDLQTDVKASLEHPITAETDDEGNPVDLYPIEDEWLIKLRFRQTTIGRLSDTRLDGRPIPEGSLESGENSVSPDS